jgi:F420-non-reducing hydrogenase small subunit
MKIATLCLTSCSGCHINLLDLQEKLLDLLIANELVYSPLLADMKEPQECDLALIEGAIRNREDVKRVKALRAKAKILVSLGTCAVYGGVAGLGNAHSAADLVEEAYPNTQDQEHGPRMLPRVFPIDSVIPVDYHLPGCPPPIEVVSNFLDDIISGRIPRGNDLPVCAECGRLVTAEIPKEIRRTYNQEIYSTECLLQQGFICLGSVTRAGCAAPCTKAGVPCMGCRGPSQRLMEEASHGIYEDLIKRRSHYTQLSMKEVERQLEPFRHSLYTYTLASPFMRTKRTEQVADWVHRVNWDVERPDEAFSSTDTTKGGAA